MHGLFLNCNGICNDSHLFWIVQAQKTLTITTSTTLFIANTRFGDCIAASSLFHTHWSKHKFESARTMSKKPSKLAVAGKGRFSLCAQLSLKSRKHYLPGRLLVDSVDSGSSPVPWKNFGVAM